MSYMTGCPHTTDIKYGYCNCFRIQFTSSSPVLSLCYSLASILFGVLQYLLVGIIYLKPLCPLLISDILKSQMFLHPLNTYFKQYMKYYNELVTSMYLLLLDVLPHNPYSLYHFCPFFFLLLSLFSFPLPLTPFILLLSLLLLVPFFR